MSDSDSDVPLAKQNGHSSKSKERIPKAMDKATTNGSSKPLPAGISIRNGPVDEMDIDSAPATNGNTKRKARNSTSKAVAYKDESDESDAVPLAKRQKTKRILDSDDDEPLIKHKAKLPPKITGHDIGDSSDDEPLITLAKEKANIEKKAEKHAKEVRAKETKVQKPKKEEMDSDDVKPKPRKAPSKKANGVKKEESDSDVPLATRPVKKATSVKVKAEVTPKKGKGKKVASEDPEEKEEKYEWWNEEKDGDDSIKWETLEHNGVVFPPDYEPLPKDVKLLYDGIPLILHVEAEEVASYFGFMLHSTLNVENPIFQKNFFNDFKEVLKKTGGAKDAKGNKVVVKEFSKLDFKPMFAYNDAKNTVKKARSNAEKKAEKEAKAAADAPYTTCKWDGREEQVGNFRVEPPGLFRGRGEHPKTGMVKTRVQPEQVIINIGKNAKVPTPPEGHKWKKVQHDNTVTWLAMWQENINGNHKYVMLSAKSSIKGQSDYQKFERARELTKHIDRIRKDYTKELKAELMADRQRATAVYLIDKFALRAGNEKNGEEEAETVGCCSLKYEHVTLRPPNTVIFDFLGKDSIRFYDEVTVDEQVFRNLKIFKKDPKQPGDELFDRLTTTQLNKHLTSYMPKLTAKVFRTYNASFTMSTLLTELKNDKKMSIQEKVKLYNDCNRKVAILCNHKRTVGASHEAQMEKMSETIKGLRYQKWRTKQMILDLDPKLKKKKGADWFEIDDDLDEAWVVAHQASLVEKERTKIQKKFEKDNEKLLAEGSKEMKAKELTERLGVADDLEKKFKKENKSKKVEAEGKSPSVEKFETAIEKLDARIANAELQAEDREGNKEVALGTSKINYIDPRLSVVFANKFQVPLEKLFSKTLRDKFTWAVESIGKDENWTF